MMEHANIRELVDAGREEEAVSLLKEGAHLVGAIGPRSAKVALEAAKLLFNGDLLSTMNFMNYRHPWLGGLTVMERAEQSDEDVDFVIEMVRAIQAGVYT